MSDYASLIRSLQLRKPRGPDDPRVRYLKDDMRNWLTLVRVYNPTVVVYDHELTACRVV
jgi:hypothetical protein